MYRGYWQLERRPFDDFADPAFYYPGESHAGALLKLRYAVENRQPAALLAGSSGIGKTQLVNTLFDGLEQQFAPHIHLVFPHMPADQLLAYIAGEISGQDNSTSTATIQESVRRIAATLEENSRHGRHAVVVVDEAQLLVGSGALEWMRLLLNFETQHGPGLTLLLVGQPGLLPALERLPSLEERLSVKCLMRPFTADETAAYVQHRLQCAGATSAIFTDDALGRLHDLSGGTPRRINRLADLALLIGFAEELDQITSAQIEEVCEELVTVTPE